MANPNGWIYWYNQRWYDYTGTSPEEMRGSGWQRVHHPDHIQVVKLKVKARLAKEESFELTFPMRRHDGVYRWFLTRVVPIKDDEGKVVKWVGTNTDVHDQILAQEEIKEKEEQLRVAIEGGELGTFDFNMHTGKVSWSEKQKNCLDCHRRQK